MKYLIGIDVGTSGTKSVLFDEKLNIVASDSKEYPLSQPNIGWAEQDPEDWSNAAFETIKNIVKKSKVSKEDIVAIGLAGQMHGLVMLDENNEVIRPAIIWADQRSGKECSEITELVGEKKLIDITANPALTGFTASKLLWVRNNEPENYKKCKKILLPKDYVRFRLSGDFATDVSDASGMQFLDIPNRDWSDEILKDLKIDKSILAKVYESPEVTGNLKKEVADELGLSPDLKIVAGAGDNAAAAVGTGVVTNGTAFTTIGTSGVVFAHTDELQIDHRGRVHTFCCAVPGSWHIMGVTQGAGLSLSWGRNNIYLGKSEEIKETTYDDINKDISEIPIGSEKLLYLPYLMGERTPHLDPYARGVFFGLSNKHNKGNMMRAIMEGVSYSLNDCFNILRELNLDVDDMMMTGGGAKSPIWQQMLSDIYNCSVSTIKSDEGAALGAAILAGVGSGVFDSIEETCEKYILRDKTVSPINENNEEYMKYYSLYKDLYTNLKESFLNLNEIE